jgi:hypothetical protein
VVLSPRLLAGAALREAARGAVCSICDAMLRPYLRSKMHRTTRIEASFFYVQP